MPLENPTPFSNWLETLALILLPVAVACMIGPFTGRRRLTPLVLGTMLAMSLASAGLAVWSESASPPDMDGHAVLRAIRDWSQVPVVMLSVRSDEGGKVDALDAGANDYVTKPFGTQELMARVRALLRLQAQSPDALPVFDDGHLRIDLARREVALDGAALVLSRKEFALLSLLLRNAGRVITQPQLLREIWGPTHTDDAHYVRILVGKLRQKLGDDAAQPRYIATEPGVGLRFIDAERRS